MRKRIICILALFSCILPLCAFAPSGGWWLDVSTQQLGDVRIYLNYGYYGDYFAESDGKPVLMYNSTVNGYILNSSGQRQYSVTIGSYGETWYYRQYSTSSSYNTPLTIIGYDPDTSSIGVMGVNVPDTPMIYYLILFFAAAILLGVWRCSRK